MQDSKYVAMIPGAGWVAVFTSDDIPDEPVLAFVMQADGTVLGIGCRMNQFEGFEFFSHYKKVGK